VLSNISSGREVFKGRLAPDEDVLWYGQPKESAIFDAQDIYLIPFSLLWGGFAIAWEAWVISDLLDGKTKSGNGGGLREFAVFGILFVVAGLYLMVGRFFAKRWLRLRTHYAITNKRAVSLVSIKTGRILSLDLGDLTQLGKSVRSDGIGTIQLGNKSWANNQDNTGLDVPMYLSSRQKPPPVFYDIPDADRVYELINDLRRNRMEPGHAHR
jgi:hypothetical protein